MIDRFSRCSNAMWATTGDFIAFDVNEELASFVLATNIKGIICKNVAKNGYYYKFKMLQWVVSASPSTPSPPESRLQEQTQFCSLGKDQDVLLFTVTLAVD